MITPGEGAAIASQAFPPSIGQALVGPLFNEPMRVETVQQTGPASCVVGLRKSRLAAEGVSNRVRDPGRALRGVEDRVQRAARESLLGHSLPMHSASVPTNVRYSSMLLFTYCHIPRKRAPILIVSLLGCGPRCVRTLVPIAR